VAPGAPLLLVAILLSAQASQSDGNRGGRLRLGSLTGSVSNRVIEELDVDAIVQRIDVDGVLPRVDVDGVLARVDVNALLDQVDPDRLLDRVDPDRLLDRVDPDRLLDRVDPDRLLDRVDPDRLLRRADVDALLAAVDVDALLARVDLDALLATVDLDALVARIDLDALLATVDIEGLTRRAGIPELIAESTGQAANSALDLTRRQLVAVDAGLLRVLQRLLRRDPAMLAPGPPRLLTNRPDEVQDPQLSRSRTTARIEVSGYYAGPASRLIAVAGDLVASAATFTATAVTVSWLLSVVVGLSFDTTQRTGPGWAVALVVWYLLWWWASVSIAGRTPIMALVGLKVVNRDGTPIRAGRSLLRTAVLPVSLGLLGAGMLLVLIDRERRSLHDLVAGAAVVYDWGGRPAELPSPISRWLAERGAVPQDAGTTGESP